MLCTSNLTRIKKIKGFLKPIGFKVMAIFYTLRLPFHNFRRRLITDEYMETQVILL